MNWLIIFDNPQGKYPEIRFLTMLNNFLKSLKKYSTIETIIYSQNRFQNIEIQSNAKNNLLNIKEKPTSSKNFDGIVISMTQKTTFKLADNTTFRNEFLRILNRRSTKNVPIIFCTGKVAFNNLINSRFFKDFNFEFHQKIGVNWFTNNLKSVVLKKMTN